MYFKNHMSKVSIVVPTYNGAKFIKEALDSIFSQSFSDFELIVVIDGSTDSTLDILKSINDQRFSIIKHDHNQGLPATLNTGLYASKGEYWTWTSDDNLYMEDTLKTMVDYLDQHAETSIVSPFLYHIQEDGKISFVSKNDLNCFLCRRSAAVELRGFRTEYMLVEDADFHLRMQHFFGPIGRIPRPMYKFRDHKRSLSFVQIQKRQFISTKLHYDLITRGIEQSKLEELFFNRLLIAALYHGYEWMDKIVAFGKEKNMPFIQTLERRSKFYRTRFGWLYVKFSVAIGGRIGQLLEIFK
jgi:glycosyltransferase involved in cell wall biosynthesis